MKRKRWDKRRAFSLSGLAPWAAASVTGPKIPSAATPRARCSQRTDCRTPEAAAALIPFHETLNRFTLVLTNATAPNYTVTWGGVTKSWPKAALEKGINLAAEFPDNPFCAPFEKVSKAVFAKQDYETRQIKTLFHGPEGRADMEMTAALTEKARAPLADAVAKSVVPVEHVLVVKAVP